MNSPQTPTPKKRKSFSRASLPTTLGILAGSCLLALGAFLKDEQTAGVGTALVVACTGAKVAGKRN